MTTILGLDIGVASVGFALISRRADARQVRILRMGMRVFPEGRTEDKQEPRNLERRTARLRPSHTPARLAAGLPQAREPATPEGGEPTGGIDHE